jgi:hypothetical protein
MIRIRPLKHRVDELLKLLSKDGFRLASGSDEGWLGDGMYILTDGRESLRITRSRNEEFLDVAFTANPTEAEWFGISELMISVGDVTFEDVIVHGVVPHDLHFKFNAYLRIRQQIAEQLGPHPETNEKLLKTREQSYAYAQKQYGRRA